MEMDVPRKYQCGSADAYENLVGELRAKLRCAESKLDGTVSGLKLAHRHKEKLEDRLVSANAELALIKSVLSDSIVDLAHIESDTRSCASCVDSANVARHWRRRFSDKLTASPSHLLMAVRTAISLLGSRDVASDVMFDSTLISLKQSLEE